MLKRLLSAILTIAMILSLIPASFASGETAATEVENVKIVYQGESYNKVAFSARADFASNKGFWCVGEYKNGTDSWYTTNSFERYYQIILQTEFNYWRSIKIHVPVKGEYSVTVTAITEGGSSNYTGDTCRFAYTILPGDATATEIDTLMSRVSWIPDETTVGAGELAAPDGVGQLNSYYEGNVHYNIGDAGGTKTLPKAKFTYNFDEPGEYIFVVKNIESNPNPKTDIYGGNKIAISSITLTKGDGTASVPMGITSLADSEITVGETATASFGTLYGSGDWAAYDTASITKKYVSSNEKVATVDADGTVTGKGAGTAEISAVIDGATLVSAPITVTAPSVKIVYDISNYYGKAAGIVTTETDYYKEVSSSFEAADLDAGIALPENFPDYSKSNGLWRYVAHTTKGTPIASYGKWDVGESNVGEWYALGFNVPMDGTYDVAIQGFCNGSSNHGSSIAYEIFPEGTSSDDITKRMNEITMNEDGTVVSGEPLCWQSGYVGGKLVDRKSVTAADVEFSTAGEYILVAKSLAPGTNTGMYIDHFILTSDETGILPIGYTKLSSDKVALGKTAAASISDKLYNANDWGTYDATGKTVTYASSNPEVAAVNETTGVITAKALGTAEITATVDGAQLAPTTITVADKEATDEVEEVSFMATSTLGEAGIEVTVTDDDYTVGDIDSSIAPGTTVKVTANPVEGYVFRGWKRGSRDNGVWLSTSSTYSFPLLTNTYLTAIYDVDTATDAAINVEFYNFNGQFLTSKAVGGNGFGTLASGVAPTLTGYNSYFWTIDGESAVADETVFEKLTRVVAKFTDTDEFAVTIPSNVESSYTSGTYAYDTEIEMTASAEGLWKVNGEPVAYGDSYTYCVWNKAVITFEAAANDNKPILSIDDNTTDGARMISYDANGADIVEVGILFGSDANIASAESRAVSRARGTEACGQFTAKAYDGTTTTARAYLIYNDNGTYRVIYAD